jgi:hypothetical protein
MVVVAVVSSVALDPQDLLPAMDLQEEADLTKWKSAIQPIATTDECVYLRSTVRVNMVVFQATYPSTRSKNSEIDD